MKNRLYTFLRIFISVSLISILLYIMRSEYSRIIDVLRKTSLPVFAFGLLMYSLALTVSAARLRLIIETQMQPIALTEAVSLTFIGYFFNNFFPTSIGGDVVKGYYLYKKSGAKMTSFSSVLVDRVIGLFTMIFMAFIALFFAGDIAVDHTVRRSIYIITVLSIIGLVFITNKKFARVFSVFLVFLKPVEDRLKAIYNVLHRYQHKRSLIFKSVLMSLVSQLLFFSTLAILAFSIGSRISMTDILLRVPIISAVSLLPSINGLGVREGSTVVLFAPLIGKEKAFAVSILWLAVLFLISIMGGLVYALSPQFKIKRNEMASQGEVEL